MGVRGKVLPVVVVVLALAATACSSSGDGASPPTTTAQPIKLNQIQVMGSHNSYHVELGPDRINGYMTVDEGAIEFAYSHEALGEQFTHQGVRQIELDVYADPNGDLWRPIGTPGFKVLHVENLDENANCETLTECLDDVKAWSDANPQHIPIAILIESKDTVDFPAPPDPLPIGPAELDALDAEIRAVFPPEDLITPDDVRGDYPTLEQAVLADNWPVLDDVRGRVMFLLDNKHDEYVQGHPSLEGRVAFAPSEPGQPDAAFVKRNDPTGDNLAQIQDLVSKGYVVRTRADSPVRTAITGDTTQLEAALASGAQWVSADYLLPGMSARWGTDFVAEMPGGTPARCNPINAPPGCTSAAIEDLGYSLGPWNPITPPVTYPIPPSYTVPPTTGGGG